MDLNETTVVLKVKCGNCDLGYAIYTCDPGWWENRNPMCPGCKTAGSATIWREEVPGPIHEYVPGNTPLLKTTARNKNGGAFNLRVRGIVI